MSAVRSIWNFLFRPERNIVLWQKIFATQFCYCSFFSLSNLVIVPFCYRIILEKIGSLRKVTIYKFRPEQVYHQKPLYYHHKKAIFNFFPWSRPVVPLIWPLLNRVRGNWTVVVLLCAWIQRKSVFLEKKSDKTIKKLRWKSPEALIWRLSGHSKLNTVIKGNINKKPSNNVFLRFFSFCFITGKFKMKFTV